MTGPPPSDPLLNVIASVFDAYSVTAFQAEEDGGAARLTASFSMGEQVNADASISPGKGLVGWILRNKAPVLADLPEENQTGLGYYREGHEPDIRSFMGCPIPGGGALCADSRQRNAFSDKQHELLHLFATMIPGLQRTDNRNARDAMLSAYIAALDRMADLRASYNGWSAYLDHLLALLVESTGFSYAALASLAEDSSRYIVEGEYPALDRQGRQPEMPVTAGVVGWVLRNGEAVVHEGDESGAGTLIFGKNSPVPEFSCSLCLPVSVNRSVCGVLCLADTQLHVFTKELRTFVRLVADDLGRMLDNISLRYRLRGLLADARDNAPASVHDLPREPSKKRGRNKG